MHVPSDGKLRTPYFAPGRLQASPFANFNFLVHVDMAEHMQTMLQGCTWKIRCEEDKSVAGGRL